MNLTRLMRAIMISRLDNKELWLHSKVYYIHHLLSEDGTRFLCTFRYRANKESTLLIRLYVDFMAFGKNVDISIREIKPYKRFSQVLFSEQYEVQWASMYEIINGKVGEILGAEFERLAISFKEKKSG